jgi:hypothetical protein
MQREWSSFDWKLADRLLAAILQDVSQAGSTAERTGSGFSPGGGQRRAGIGSGEV